MKSYFKTLFFTVTMLLFSQVLLAQWQGAGTEEDPFKIYTIEDLENITNNQNGYNISYTDIHFELMNDIEAPLTHKLCWDFNGYFHGKGHFITLDFHDEDYEENILVFSLNGTIDSLTFEGNVSNFYSLFVQLLSTGKLSNVICNLNISVTEGIADNYYYYICYIFCLQNQGIIEHCVNNSDLYIDAVGNNTKTEIYLSRFTIQNSGTIAYCVNNGKVILDVNSFCNINVSCFNELSIYCSSSITNCINTGDVIINGVANSTRVSCFNGHHAGLLSNCLNTGNIYARKSDYVGVFANENHGTVSNCLNLGKLTGEDIAGGIVGINVLDNIMHIDYFPVKIENCVNAGEIVGSTSVGGIFAESTEYTVNPLPNDTIRNNLCLSKTSKYALFGCEITPILDEFPSVVIENNFYDKQMVTQTATPEGDIPGKAEGKLTTEITGFALQYILGDGWSYAEGRYPIPLGLENHPAALLAATPVFLHYTDQDNYNSVDSVSEHFKVGVETGAEWQTSYNNVAINGQKAKLQHIGYENLKASIDNFSKNIIINIKNVPEDIYYTVSGTVKSNGEPLENVTILYSDTYTFTDENGYYSFEILEDENVTVTPSLQGYTFIPTDSTINNIMQNIENVNFAANTTGIDDVAVQKLIFYPNPVKNELKIKNEELKMENYTIFNVAGQVLMQGKLSDKTINVKSLQGGMYFIKIGNTTGKFIKK